MIKKMLVFFSQDKLLQVFWALVILCMPVTSFRFLPLGDSTWRPLAIVPALILAGCLFLGALRGRKLKFPQPTSVVFVLLLFVILGTILINGIYAPANYLGQSYWDRVLRAGVTLFFGLVFFFVGLQMNQTEEAMQFTLKWVLISFTTVAIVGAFQWLALFKPIWFDRWDYNVFHEFWMIKGLRIRRIIGFAYEPGWFADQLVFVFLPWMMMSLLTGKRILRYWWMELFGVLIGVLLLLFTYSRSGIFSFVIVFGLFFLIYAPRYLKSFFHWFFKPFRKEAKGTRDRGIALILRVGLVVGFVGAFILMGVIFSSNNYFSRLWESDLSQGLMHYLEQNSLSARLLYAIMGLRVFFAHPWTGVGFGALGFYMPNFFLTGLMDGSTEVSRFMAGEALRFLNAKNMYVRMASETGIFGLVVFLVFLASVMGLVWRLRKNENKNVQFVGGASFLIVTGIVIRFFTFDSFASPTIWVTLGIVVSLLSTVQFWNKEKGM